MLLDTSFIIDLLRGRKTAVDKIKMLEAESLSTNISSPSIFELFVGISLTKKPSSEKKKVMDVLLSWGTLSLDSECAALAGKIHGQLINEGQPIDPEDSMIAAIAIVNNETLLTKNTKHFKRVPDLKIEDY
ncbi:MAG: type II toxin-antitoxin system VapC family toxin [Candidatus Thorarchaeota archaeon]